MKTRKILYFDLVGPFGGIENYLVSLSQILSGEAELYAICVNQRLREALVEKNVTLIPERPMKEHGKLLNLLYAAFLFIWARFRYGITIVWIQGYSEIVLLPLARLFGCKAIATRHLTKGSEATGLGTKVAQKAYELLAFTAHRIFCVSEAVATDMRRLVDDDHLAVIPNWVSSVPKEPNHTAGGERLRLLFVGRLQPHKGAALILKAMRDIQAEKGSCPLSLTIVGEGESQQELERLAQGLNVEFVGFQKDPSRFYREADVFINPSLGPEGLPLVSLEAMSYGLPCIFSDIPVHHELSGEGRSAALFKAGDAEDLYVTITRLAADLGLRSDFGLHARAAIMAKHNPQAARSAYLDQLNTLGKAA